MCCRHLKLLDHALALRHASETCIACRCGGTRGPARAWSSRGSVKRSAPGSWRRTQTRPCGRSRRQRKLQKLPRRLPEPFAGRAERAFLYFMPESRLQQRLCIASQPCGRSRRRARLQKPPRRLPGPFAGRAESALSTGLFIWQGDVVHTSRYFLCSAVAEKQEARKACRSCQEGCQDHTWSAQSVRLLSVLHACTHELCTASAEQHSA